MRGKLVKKYRWILPRFGDYGEDYVLDYLGEFTFEDEAERVLKKHIENQPDVSRRYNYVLEIFYRAL